MKTDAIVFSIVIVLTAVVPCFVYWSGGEKWSKESDESAASAQRYEQLARDIEEGKIKPVSVDFPAYLRLQAHGNMELARMYGYLAEADRKFLSATGGVVGTQAALLGWLLLRRRKREMRDAEGQESNQVN